MKLSSIVIALAFVAIAGTFLRMPIAFYKSADCYHERLPVTFRASGYPVVQVVVEGRQCRVRFNTISEESLGLNNKILEILQKKESGLSQWKTFSGVEDLIASEMHTYRLPLVRIGKKRFYDVEVTEDHGEEEGCMGNGLIGLQNVLLDFPHSLIYMSNQCDKLAKAGYPINRWVQIPFQKTGNGSAVIEVCMDGGTKKLALGTGSCDSLLIGQEDADANGEGGVFTTSRLIIGGKDFGSMDLERVKPNELFEFDGILGMNFLAKHPVYIDYVHQNLYLE